MENTTETNLTTSPSTPSLLASSFAHAILALVTFVSGSLAAIFAAAYAILTIINFPIFLHRSLTLPFQTLFGTAIHLISILAIAALGVSLFAIAYRLIKRRSITRWNFATCLILLIIATVLVCGIAPSVCHLSTIPSTYFTGLTSFP